MKPLGVCVTLLLTLGWHMTTAKKPKHKTYLVETHSKKKMDVKKKAVETGQDFSDDKWENKPPKWEETTPKWEHTTESTWVETTKKPDWEPQSGNTGWEEKPPKWKHTPKAGAGAWDKKEEPKWDHKTEPSWDHQPTEPAWDHPTTTIPHPGLVDLEIPKWNPPSKWDHKTEPAWDEPKEPGWDGKEPEPHAGGWEQTEKPKWDHKTEPVGDEPKEPGWDGKEPEPHAGGWEQTEKPIWDHKTEPAWDEPKEPGWDGKEPDSQLAQLCRHPLQDNTRWNSITANPLFHQLHVLAEQLGHSAHAGKPIAEIALTVKRCIIRGPMPALRSRAHVVRHQVQTQLVGFT